jgi:uncharacterized protein
MEPQYWKGKPVVQFHVMAKPFGPVCNLDCTYCYYLSKRKMLNRGEGWRMSWDVLEEFIRQYIQGQNCGQIVFTWQGGEPTLLGVDFFRKVVALQRKYAPPDVRIENDLQTSGILLDRSWCEFLRDNGFLVGLSIDGPQHLHDRYRLDRNGQSTFRKVINAARLLSDHGVRFNTLTAVNRKTAREPLAVYRFLRDQVRSTRIQFIPIAEPVSYETVAPQCWETATLPKVGTPRAEPGSPDSVVTKWSVAPDDYGTFLCKVFDEWYERDIGEVFVYHFECALAQWMGMEGTICVFASECGRALVLEHDGDVYSCDHYVYPEYLLGNIKRQSLVTLAFSQQQTRFGFAKSRALPEYCRQCEFLFACHGECPRTRFVRTPDGEPGLSYLCAGLKRYFRHIDPYMTEMAKSIIPSGLTGTQ